MKALLWRDLRQGWRHGADTLAPVLFLLLAVATFPLALGPAPDLLARIAPAIVWVCALLAAMLPLDRLFAADVEDGTLDQLIVSGLSAPEVALVKAAGHWLTTGLPLWVASLPSSAILGLDWSESWSLLVGLAPGTMALSLLGTAAAAAVVGARRSGTLLPLLMLPLSVPVLVFGNGAMVPDGFRPNMLLLGALLCAALPLCPLAAGAGLRAAADS